MAYGELSRAQLLLTEALNNGHAEEVAAKFWAKAHRGEPNACWDWHASMYKNGYGMFHLAGNIAMVASRASWQLANGLLTDPLLLVCHKCDRRICVNPSHLFLGRAKDNTADMIAKGRRIAPAPLRGELNHKAKLTWNQVHEVQSIYANRVKVGPRASRTVPTYAETAERLGVCPATISHIANGRIWKEVA